MKIAHAYIKKKRLAKVVQPRYMQPKKVFSSSLVAVQAKKVMLASAFKRKDSIARNSHNERSSKQSTFADSKQAPAIQVRKTCDGEEPPKAENIRVFFVVLKI